MNGSKKSDVWGRTADEYALVLKAAEIVEVVRCAHPGDAEGMVVDMLRALAPSRPTPKQITHTSGFMAKAAQHAAGPCDCGQVNRLFRHPSGHLCCANCVMDDILASD